MQGGGLVVAILGHGVVGHQLATNGIQYPLHILHILRFHTDKGSAAKAARSHQPAGQLGGQGGFAQATAAAHHGVGFLLEQALQV